LFESSHSIVIFNVQTSISMNQNLRDKLVDEVMSELYVKELMNIQSIHAHIQKKSPPHEPSPEIGRFNTSVVDTMLREGLVISASPGNPVKKLTLKGKQIVEEGGWEKYVELESLKRRRESDLKEYQRKYLPYIFSFLSLVVSVAAFVKSSYKGDSEIQKEQFIAPVAQPLDTVASMVLDSVNVK
jgi:hypothetical protein